MKQYLLVLTALASSAALADWSGTIDGKSIVLDKVSKERAVLIVNGVEVLKLHRGSANELKDALSSLKLKPLGQAEIKKRLEELKDKLQEEAEKQESR